MANKKGLCLCLIALLFPGVNLWAAPLPQSSSSDAKLYLLRNVPSERALGYLKGLFPESNLSAVEVKERNGLLLSGTRAKIQLAESLLEQIDEPPLQVTLSCTVVEFKRGNRDGILGESNFVCKSGAQPDSVEMKISAMEVDKRAEVLARPKITAVSGNKAELNVTHSAYYRISDVSPEGFPITDYRSFNDGFSLEVTPTVARGGRITLDVYPEIKVAGGSTGDGPRDISTRNLRTTVVLNDGETFCLGGLIRKKKSDVRSAVPVLGDLPLVGRFFSSVSEVEEESELAIFITPHVNLGKPIDN